MRTVLVLAFTLWALVANAGTLGPPAGTLESCTAACGTVSGSTTNVNADGSAAIVFQFRGSGTVDTLVQHCNETPTTCDSASSWSTVSGASCTGCASPTKWTVSQPTGFYRFAVSTCTACTYHLSYRAVRR